MSPRPPIVLTLAALCVLPATAAAVADVRLPAASVAWSRRRRFAQLGGWVIDQQFMDQMGSPYLLAHGLGDAGGRCDDQGPICPPRDVPRAGPHPRLGRPVARAGAPGPVPTPRRRQAACRSFGTEGADWHWQDGGSVEIAGREVDARPARPDRFRGPLRRHPVDQATPALVPPDAGPELAEFRRKLLGLPEKPADGGRFDLVVVGGGIAGICAALSAARLGLSVALVQDRPVWAATTARKSASGSAAKSASSPIPTSATSSASWSRSTARPPRHGRDVRRRQSGWPWSAPRRHCTLLLSQHVNQVEKAGDRIEAVVAEDIRTARRTRLAGRWFADCTGDAAVGFLAGADFDMTRHRAHGPLEPLDVADTGQPVAFPRCPWAVRSRPHSRSPRSSSQAGQVVLGESVSTAIRSRRRSGIRDTNFRAMYGAWDALKNVRQQYPRITVSPGRPTWPASGSRAACWATWSSAARTCSAARPIPTAACRQAGPSTCTWPTPVIAAGCEDDPFIAHVASNFEGYPRPYWIPYRCLYSRNVANLFMAGRNISVTHEALGSTRVMRTGGCCERNRASSVFRQRAAMPEE